MSEPSTESGRNLIDRLASLDTVPIEWAPAHTTPYVSKFLVEPIVEMSVVKIEAEARRRALITAEDAVRSVVFDLPIGENVDYSRGYSAAVAENRRALIEMIRDLREAG